jgi:hypothetical protein
MEKISFSEYVINGDLSRFACIPNDAVHHTLQGKREENGGASRNPTGARDTMGCTEVHAGSGISGRTTSAPKEKQAILADRGSDNNHRGDCCGRSSVNWG